MSICHEKRSEISLGANYQIGAFVFGVEADGDWTKTGGFGTFTATSLCAGGCLTNSNWLATARGRFGCAFDRFLAYGTAGAAFGNAQRWWRAHPR